MTVIAEVLLVTHRAYFRPLPGRDPVVIHKIDRMVEPAMHNPRLGLVMTFGTDRFSITDLGILRVYKGPTLGTGVDH
jgi:hypothetical protein